MHSMLNLDKKIRYLLFMKPFHESPRIVVVRYSLISKEEWCFYGEDNYKLSPASMRITWFIRKWI